METTRVLVQKALKGAKTLLQEKGWQGTSRTLGHPDRRCVIEALAAMTTDELTFARSLRFDNLIAFFGVRNIAGKKIVRLPGTLPCAGFYSANVGNIVKAIEEWGDKLWELRK